MCALQQSASDNPPSSQKQISHFRKFYFAQKQILCTFAAETDKIMKYAYTNTASEPMPTGMKMMAMVMRMMEFPPCR